MLEIEGDALEFIRERLTESAGEVRASLRDDDPAARAARAKVLDAAAGVLSALQTLLHAAEEMVLHRRDRLVAEAAKGPEPTGSTEVPDARAGDAAETIRLTY
jgi:hypothetical protein